MVSYIKHHFFVRYRTFDSRVHLNQLAEQRLREEADRRAHADIERSTALAPRMDALPRIGTRAGGVGRLVQHTVLAFGARVSDAVKSNNNIPATVLSLWRFDYGEHDSAISISIPRNRREEV